MAEIFVPVSETFQHLNNRNDAKKRVFPETKTVLALTIFWSADWSGTGFQGFLGIGVENP